MKEEWRISRPVAAMVGRRRAGVAVLSTVSVGRVAHFEWLVLGAQFAVLLPALLYGLKRRGAGGAAEFLPD